MHNHSMNERISCLSVLRLKPGMILARDLLRPDGAVLMAAGTELTESQLGQLQQRGIEVVFVREPDPRSPEEIEVARAAAQARVEYIFRVQAVGEGDKVPPGDARMELRNAILAYRTEGSRP
jgi:hypothetical protein